MAVVVQDAGVAEALSMQETGSVDVVMKESKMLDTPQDVATKLDEASMNDEVTLPIIGEDAEATLPICKGVSTLDDTPTTPKRSRTSRGMAETPGSLQKRPLGSSDDVVDATDEKKVKTADENEDSASESSSDSDDSDLSDEEEVDEEVQEGPEVAQDLLPVAEVGKPVEDIHKDYKVDWSSVPKPGSKHFNEKAVAALQAGGVAVEGLKTELDTGAACPPLQPHQESAIALLHPKSKIARMLVDHPTGSGKTREMIHILDNYFFDPRPKVPIFPKEPVCRNFYAELLRWPNRYRNFYCVLRPEQTDVLLKGADWRERRDQLWDLASLTDLELKELCRDVRETLEMKGWFYMGRMRKSRVDAFQADHPDEPLPAGPLRALRYTSAGGMHSMLREDGWPKSALFKICFDHGDPNVYSKKIVIMDEVHNLVRTQTQYAVQLQRLRSLLSEAHEMVLAGFTGTPILSEPHEGRTLLDIIKGVGAPSGDQGFVSSFPMRPTPLFPQSLPIGMPDAVLTPALRRRFVQKVTLTGETLQKYDEKRSKGALDRRLRAYCSLCVHFGSFHSGKSGSKARVLKNFAACAPKLEAIARDVAASPEKVLILIDRHSGMIALLEYLRGLGAQKGFGVATMDQIAAFNSASDNLRGEKFRVMVADASTCSEGVSFFSVRRVMLADVPSTPSGLVQSVGRAIRMYSHRSLPSEEQTVTTYLYMAGFPRWMRSPLGAWAFRVHRRHADPVESVSRAQHLLRVLKRVGIVSFEDFKNQLDRYAATAHITPKLAGRPLTSATLAAATQGTSKRVLMRQESDAVSLESPSDRPKLAPLAEDADAEKAPLDAKSCIGFLESIGLWDEAKSIKNAGLSTKNLPFRRGSSRRMDMLRKIGQGKPIEVDSPEKRLNKHYMVRALCSLHEAAGPEEAVEEMRLETRTADEKALSLLTTRSREFVPALESLRKKAVDRELLLSLVEQKEEQTEVDMEHSDGESTVNEFGFASGSEDEAWKHKDLPLVLPAGWRVEHVQQGKRRVRVFVDPEGESYKTEAAAKVAVADFRRKENMAERLRSRFSAKFAASAELDKSPSSDSTAASSGALLRSVTTSSLEESESQRLPAGSADVPMSAQDEASSSATSPRPKRVRAE